MILLKTINRSAKKEKLSLAPCSKVDYDCDVFQKGMSV
jgi:hypothetical protein